MGIQYQVGAKKSESVSLATDIKVIVDAAVLRRFLNNKESICARA